ncbi:hypothetical protein Zmor_023641 [Zophobas morio]|uniref:Pacifastin domain-containing protein n=1 Tax=Zophobas morio TaxID=2755281 RepID=A0AA38HXK9_9CUCU|nr:hypothetical protein Zmor_023641 [Zophobas morio]
MKTIILCLIFSVLVATVLSDECNPGDTKKIDCNSCKCTNGVWACSRRLCISRPTRETHCTPGSTFKKDCNTCVCNQDGTNAACTLKACL